MTYYINKTSLKRGKSNIKSPQRLLNKRAAINPKSNDDKCFQYAITAALNHQKTENHPEKILNIKSFFSQYNWKGMNFLAGIEDWKNNKSIAILYIVYTSK